MRNLIKCIAAVVAIGLWCAGTVWNMIQERKLRQEREDLARARRARGMLRLSDKPYMLPKQGQDHEIRVIQEPKEPEAVPLCDYQCRSKTAASSESS